MAKKEIKKDIEKEIIIETPEAEVEITDEIIIEETKFEIPEDIIVPFNADESEPEIEILPEAELEISVDDEYVPRTLASLGKADLRLFMRTGIIPK